jgi:hypothetical protein
MSTSFLAFPGTKELRSKNTHRTSLVPPDPTPATDVEPGAGLLPEDKEDDEEEPWSNRVARLFLPRCAVAAGEEDGEDGDDLPWFCWTRPPGSRLW